MPQQHPDSPASFPSPLERERIIRRRAALSHALIAQLVVPRLDATSADKQRAALSREYGADEVRRMLGRITRQLNRPRGDAEEPWLYDEYVALYRRFGGSRPLLSFEEQRSLNYERTLLKARQEFNAGGPGSLGPPRLGPLSPEEGRRLAEIDDLLLADADLWDDLVPEDPPAVLPPAPARQLAPPTLIAPARKPGRNEPCWCGSGRKYKHCHLSADNAR
ncbi:SEC-C metal-binding domain-containing protein [Oscillochloris sp. ZM17-4]|uniref:SEC-C metal-binding domain-containing protein n=1 Tax=Oscillochloris sp. ZM17-4 TaxID=2866714 RepID=UPI002107D100|nr:SEC-C domain-containing protein [Oscillochloris sp. ZM17-4]